VDTRSLRRTSSRSNVMYANILNTKAKRVWEPLAEKAPDKGCLRKGPAPCAREQ